MDKKTVRIAAIGDNCIDYYTESGEAFPGGNPVNVAVYTKRLGHNASYIGAVGNDENGEVVLNALNKKGVDTSHVHVLDGPTAVTEVTVIDGDRKFGTYREGVLSDFKLSEDDIEFAGQHDLIVSGIWGMIEDDLHLLKRTGKPIAFDFSDQFKHPLVEKVISHTDFAFFAADEECEALLIEKMKRFKEMGPKLIIVTRGSIGSLAYDGHTVYRYGVLPCDVVDTMGAGDSFIAGFLVALLRVEDVEGCMACGAKNSSITIQYSGAWE